MTDTSTLPVDLTHIEPEFDHSCQYRLPPFDCPHPATFLAWMSHTVIGCPAYCYVCDTCMADSIELVAKALKQHATCTTCQQALTGLITDNVRFIKL